MYSFPETNSMLSVSTILLSLEVVAVWQVMILGILCRVKLTKELCLPKLGLVLATLYPMKYAHSFDLFCCGLSLCFVESCNLYTHILQEIRHWHWGNSIKDMCKFHQYQTLPHLGGDKMAAIIQTKFSNAFSWMKMYEFNWSCKISLKFFPKLQIDNILSLYEIWLGVD